MIMMAFNVKMMTCLDMISHQSFIKNYIIGLRPSYLHPFLPVANPASEIVLAFPANLMQSEVISHQH